MSHYLESLLPLSEADKDPSPVERFKIGDENHQTHQKRDKHSSPSSRTRGLASRVGNTRKNSAVKELSVVLSVIAGALMIALCIYCLSVEYRLSVMSFRVEQAERQNGHLEKLLRRLLETERAVESKSSVKFQDRDQKKATTTPSDGEYLRSVEQSLAQDDDDSNDTDDGVDQVRLQAAVQSQTRVKRNAVKKDAEHKRDRSTVNRRNSSSDMVALPLIHMEVNASTSRQKQPEDAGSFNFWAEAGWAIKKKTRKNFRLDVGTGHVSVTKGGVYLVYVQIVYHDAIGRWSAGLVVNDQTRAKCLESEQLKDINDYSESNHGVYKQCSLTVLVKLNANQNVSVRCMYGQRTILSQPEFTYWGMVKVA